MSEGHCAVMREVALDQDMTVEALHLRNREYTDASEGMSSHRQNLAICNIGTQSVICGALQTEEGDVARNNIALQGSLGYLLRKASCHDQLILHLAEGQLLCGGIAAVETHEDIMALVIKLVLNLTVVKIIRYRIVDIQERHCILADTGSDEFT